MNLNLKELIEISKERWFTPEEINEILNNYKILNIKLNKHKINNPQSGMFYLFDRLEIPDFKLDGINWEKKKNSHKAHEQYLKLLIKGVHVITGQYTTCSTDACFRRRCYRLADSNSSIQLVHYRNCEGDAYVRKTRKNSITNNEIIPSNQNIQNINHVQNINNQHNPIIFTQQPLQPQQLQHNFTNSDLLYSSNYQYSSPSFDFSSSTIDNNLHSYPNLQDEIMEEVYDDVDYENLLLLVGESDNEQFITQNDQNNYNNMNDSSEFNSTIKLTPTSTINLSISPTNINLPQTSTNSQMQLSTIRILDFAPSTGSLSGGEKILICLGQDIHPNILQLYQIHVMFKSVESSSQNLDSMIVPTEILSPSVLRIRTPPLKSIHLRYELLVCTQQGAIISLPSSEEFTYLKPSVVPNSTTFPISTESNEILNNNNNNNNNTNDSSKSTVSRKRPSLTNQTINNIDNFSSENNNNNSFNISSQSSSISSDSVNIDDSRIHKIRIVEKFLTTNPLQITFPPPNSTISTEDDWLDDKSISLLSSSDLEKLMDKYLLNVINQLVQLAISDDDLKAELDHVDPSGYSLLHYCCLFNLPSLVEMLISKGANVNLRTGIGSTPLHLASDSGHFEIIQQLVAVGADITLTDNRGLTAAESSFMIGQPALPSYWHLLSTRVFPSETFIPSPKRKNDSSSSYATTPVGSQSSSKLSHFNFDINTIEQFSIPQSENMRVTPAYILSDDESTTTEFDIQFTVNDNSLFSSLNDNREQNIQLYTPPISRKSSIVGLDNENNSNVTPNTSMTLLQGAVSALSLADKCALSLSLGNSRIQSPDDFEVQSVLSEYDKESLDVAMSMMGPQELSLVEDEVRIIQNNVRTWLLRKNYINLRDAAKTLQIAWREKRNEKYQQQIHKGKKDRKKSISELETINELTKLESTDSKFSHQQNYYQEHNNNQINQNNQNQNNQNYAHEYYSQFIQNQDNNQYNQEINSNNDSSYPISQQISNDKAASTLQAATRGMLARKEFHLIKRQTMASLVIQKSLLHWWIQKGLSSSNDNNN